MKGSVADDRILIAQPTMTGKTRMAAYAPRTAIGFLVHLLVISCALVLMVHLPALSSGGLSIDDSQYLTNNALVANPGWESVLRFFTEISRPSTVKGYYQPLTMISLMTDYAVGGRPHNLTAFHRTSIVLHLANVALVTLLLYQLFNVPLVAAVGGLLFGMHPMTVEVIAWISERKTVLATFFALCSLVLYLEAARRDSGRLRLASVIAYALGLLCKPTIVVIPALMLLLDYWPLRRLKWQSVCEKTPFFIIGGLSTAVTCWSQNQTAGLILPGQYHAWYAPLIFCHNLVFYLHHIIWPANLPSYCAFPAHLELSNPKVFLGVFGTCVLVPLVALSLYWTRAVATAFLIFIVGLFPVSQVVNVNEVIAAFKYVYLPSVGLIVLGAWLLCMLSQFGGQTRPLLRYGAIAAVLTTAAGGEAIATRQQYVHWRDTRSVYEHMLVFSPDAAPIHHNLGTAYLQKGQLDQAAAHYARALELNPRIIQAHYGLGVALRRKGRLDDAVIQFQRVLDLKPGDRSARYLLGLTLASLNRCAEAAQVYHLILRDDPNLPYVHEELGRVLLAMHATDEGMRHMREALRLSPDNPGVVTRLAWLLATHTDGNVRSPKEALQLATHAAVLVHRQHPRILDVLAAAYAANDQFEEASRTAVRASQLATARGDYELAGKIRARLAFYQRYQAYREHPAEEGKVLSPERRPESEFSETPYSARRRSHEVPFRSIEPNCIERNGYRADRAGVLVLVEQPAEDPAAV